MRGKKARQPSLRVDRQGRAHRQGKAHRRGRAHRQSQAQARGLDQILHLLYRQKERRLLQQDHTHPLRHRNQLEVEQRLDKNRTGEEVVTMSAVLLNKV